MTFYLREPKTDQDYAEQLAPYLLNAIFELAERKTSTKVLKIDAFLACSAGGHKGDKKKLEQYASLKGEATYYGDVQRALDVLFQRGFALQHKVNPAYVMITDTGIGMCETPIAQNGWHHSIFRPNKVEPHLMRLK